MNNPKMTSKTKGAPEPLLEVENLKKYFVDTTGLKSLRRFGLYSSSNVKAVDGVSFNIYPNEIVGVVGESGCGKSTLGKTLLKLTEPTEGVIKYDGDDISELSNKQMRPFRENMQIIFQDPTSSLTPTMKIRDLIVEPIENFGSYTGEELEIRVDDLLKQVELPIEFKERYPHELSGGQKQRVVIARALASNPDFIVADEPVTGLDVSIQSKIINLLKKIQKERQLSILFIAHDLNVVRHISDRVIVLYLGNVVEMGETESVIEHPQHPYTRLLRQSIPKSHPEEDKIREENSGEPPSPIDPPTGCRFHPRCPAYIDDGCAQKQPALVELADQRSVRCHHFDENGDAIPGTDPGLKESNVSTTSTEKGGM